MTAFAYGEVVIAESALAVVARRTTLRAPGRVMIQRLRCRDLTSLRQAGPDLMTVVAVRLGIVPGMTEPDIEGRHILRCARVAA